MKLPMLGVINLIQEADEMGMLTEERCAATVPFGGRYRLIDFTLSSMVNSGISRVSVFAHSKYRSLVDHLGSGSNWDLHRKQSSLFILPPVLEELSDFAKGDLYHFYRHRDYFARSSMEYVVISRSHMVCNVDLGKVLEEHRTSGADVTVVCKQQTDVVGLARKVRLGADQRVVEMQDHFGRMETDVISMEMYVMHRELLLDMVETGLAQGKMHFIRDLLMSSLGTLHVHAYMHGGYLAVVNNIPSYFRHSLELLKPQVWNELFFSPGLIYTKVKDEPPTRYRSGSNVTDSLVANGCEIAGTVQGSVLFRGVKVKEGAVIRNSIVMQNSVIGEEGSVENCILDKEAVIQPLHRIKGSLQSPYVAGKRQII